MISFDCSGPSQWSQYWHHELGKYANRARCISFFRVLLVNPIRKAQNDSEDSQTDFRVARPGARQTDSARASRTVIPSQTRLGRGSLAAEARVCSVYY